MLQNLPEVIRKGKHGEWVGYLRTITLTGVPLAKQFLTREDGPCSGGDYP